MVRGVIVVGASLSGVTSLQKLVKGLPQDLPAAILIVQHVAAHTPGATSRSTTAASWTRCPRCSRACARPSAARRIAEAARLDTQVNEVCEWLRSMAGLIETELEAPPRKG